MKGLHPLKVTRCFVCDLITNIFGDLPQLRRHCWSVHLSRHPSQAAQPPVTWYMPWQSKQPAPNVGPGAYILSKSISWSFMSILMPIPLIKAIWMADFHGIWLLLPWRIQPRLIVMKQLSELMENLQDVHPYTTKRMHAFKSPRMKYIKTLHATSLLSAIFNAVNTPSFCGKPQSLGSLFQRFFSDKNTKTEASTAEIAAIHAANELQSDSLCGSSPLCGILSQKCFKCCCFHPSLRDGTIQTIIFSVIFTISLRIPEFSQSFQPQLPLGHHMRVYDVLLSDHQNPHETRHLGILVLVFWKALLRRWCWFALTMLIYSLGQTVRPRVMTLKLTW